jgi:glycosyltransferase involved in cell wall biosynthesis
MKLSVVLATYNEAHNLERCLQAVKSVADEVVVVDGKSPDGTAELAEKLGARVISTTNKANFHINKQLAIDVAKYPLVLQLDADEVIDEELITWLTLLKTMKLEDLRDAAWWIKRKNYFLGTFLKKGGQYPDPVIRLLVNGKAKLPQKDVHEQMKVSGTTGWAEGHLLHYSSPSFAEYLRKFNTYTSFEAQKLHDKKTPISFKNSWRYCIWKPLSTFCSLFLRHRGYVDGFPGFMFAAWSGIFHTVTYLKLWELSLSKSK